MGAADLFHALGLQFPGCLGFRPLVGVAGGVMQRVVAELPLPVDLSHLCPAAGAVVRRGEAPTGVYSGRLSLQLDTSALSWHQCLL